MIEYVEVIGFYGCVLLLIAGIGVIAAAGFYHRIIEKLHAELDGAYNRCDQLEIALAKWQTKYQRDTRGRFTR